MKPLPKFARTGIISLVVSLGLGSAAGAQQMTETMSCQQLITYFENNRVAWKNVNGKVLPIRSGVPIKEFSSLTCGPRNYTVVRNYARTTDNPRCVFSAYCHGKSNISE